MPMDLYAERVRLVTGSLTQGWTVQAYNGYDPNGVVTEPSGSLLRDNQGRIWINVDSATQWSVWGGYSQVWTQTATGLEGTELGATLPVPFTNTIYQAMVTNFSGTYSPAFKVINKSTTGFTVVSTAPFISGDKLDFLAISGGLGATVDGQAITNLSGTLNSALVSLSGTINSAIVALSSSVALAGSPIVARTGLTSAASTISVSGLDGDTDREYEIEFNYLATSTSAHDLDIRPNGDTSSNRNTTRVLDGGTPATSAAGIFTTNGGVTNALSARYTFTCFVARDAAITYYRRFLANGTLSWNLGVGNGNYTAVTVYSSNAANLTSLTIGVTVTQFASGSELIVRKKIR